MRRKSDLLPIERIMKQLNDEASDCQKRVEYYTKRLTEVGDDHRPVIEGLLETQQRSLAQVNEEVEAMTRLLNKGKS